MQHARVIPTDDPLRVRTSRSLLLRRPTGPILMGDGGPAHKTWWPQPIEKRGSTHLGRSCRTRSSRIRICAVGTDDRPMTNRNEPIPAEGARRTRHPVLHSSGCQLTAASPTRHPLSRAVVRCYPCPTCQAMPGDPCRRESGRRMRRAHHAERVALAPKGLTTMLEVRTARHALAGAWWRVPVRVVSSFVDL